MNDAVTVVATINGEPFHGSIPPRLTLVELLRDRLGLRGTKVSCEMQVCGACTVLVDDLPTSACSYLAVDIDGRSVTSIEGLGRPGDLHPLQQAFIEEFALQCGFCTPGFIVMAKALLDLQPDPSRQDVVDYLDGNMCRCTGYQPIIDAVLKAAAVMRGEA
jgi:aerobic-type carbon monoxide dehydrogenase small subunit (CoxS/CutS family)